MDKIITTEEKWQAISDKVGGERGVAVLTAFGAKPTYDTNNGEDGKRFLEIITSP